MQTVMDNGQERVFVLIKPDGVKRGLIGEIIGRIERRGLKIVGLQMIQATREQVHGHYPQAESWIKRLGEKSLATYERYGWDPMKEMGTNDPMEIGKSVREWILDYMTSGPVVKIVVEGLHAIEAVRKLGGHTIPSMAEMGTIRGDFSVDSAAFANREKRPIYNLVHMSETVEEATHELAFWFKDEDVHDYKRAGEDVMFPTLADK